PIFRLLHIFDISYLHSFPTRRSSDLRALESARVGFAWILPSRYSRYRVCAKFIGEKPAGYQPAARCSQNSSQRPLSWEQRRAIIDRKSTRLNSSHQIISYAVFCLKKK